MISLLPHMKLADFVRAFASRCASKPSPNLIDRALPRFGKLGFLFLAFFLSTFWLSRIALAEEDAGPFGAAAPTYFPALSLGEFSGDVLIKLSGAAVGRRNPSLIWTHNDGNIRQIHALRRNGSLAATLSFGTAVLDLEDIAIGSGPTAGTPYLYLGDIGGIRSTITIIRAPEPAFPAPTILPETTVISLSYPDGAYEAETILVDPLSGDLFVVSRQNSSARFYRTTAVQLVSGSPSVMEFVAEVPFEIASGGDISSDGRLIVLRNETEARMWTRNSDESVGEAVLRLGHAVPVAGPPADPNGEAIAFDSGSAAYITLSEGKKEHILSFRPNPSGFGAGSALGTVQNEDLKEVSGVAVSRRSPGVIWVHNDGMIDRIFAIDLQGNMLATLMLGRVMHDVEDITIGQIGENGVSYLFVGDTGDNEANRTSIGVLRFPEPQIDPVAVRSVTLSATGAEWLSLSFPNYPADCEAVMFDPVSENLLLATKETNYTRIFSVAAMAPTGTPQILAFVSSVGFERVSGGDISPGGNEIVLRREERAELWKRRPEQSLAEAFYVPGLEIPIMTPPVEKNGESFAFHPGGSGYYTIGEKKNAPIFHFSRLPLDQLIGFSNAPRQNGNQWVLDFEGFPGATALLEASIDLITWTPIDQITLDV